MLSYHLKYLTIVFFSQFVKKEDHLRETAIAHFLAHAGQPLAALAFDAG